MDIYSLPVTAGRNVSMDEHYLTPYYLGHRAIALCPRGRSLLRT